MGDVAVKPGRRPFHSKRRVRAMKLYVHPTAQGNFGDDLNPWLWSSLLGDLLDDDDDERLLGIGTVIRPYRRPRTCHVLGAGVGYGEVRARDLDPVRWRFHAVRGPLTAGRLGLDPALAITDPALLVRRLPWPRAPRRRGVAFMPHHDSARAAAWGELAAEAGLTFIDPRRGPFRALQAIDRSELLVTEAMHGAIVADALRVPWIPVRLYPWILDFKWRDWSASVGLTHRFERPRLDVAPWPETPASAPRRLGRWLKRKLAVRFLATVARARPRLSSEATLAALEDRLLATIERFRREPAINRRAPGSPAR